MKCYVCIAFCYSLAVLAQAPPQQEGPPPPWGILRIADSDYDDSVSASEWSTFLDQLPQGEDGGIDPAILHQSAEAHRANRPRGRGHKGATGERRGGRGEAPGKRGAYGARDNQGNNSDRAPHDGQAPPPREKGARGGPGEDALDFDHNGQLAAMDLQSIFEALDQNADGILQREELPAPPPPPPRGRR